MVGDDWEKWDAIPLPTDRYNGWGENFAELFDWHPWLRSFYTTWEVNFNTRPVGVHAIRGRYAVL